MNEIFEYGQKVIFKSNQSEFSNETIKEWLDKLYDMLEKNPSLNIKITGYYWGLNSPLPLERAEKVKKYLVNKWIDTERIQAEWWKEQIAKSIKIEIIK
jgi:outer membrane protein OmpA-like peptidoglycan-associated protein